MDSKSSSEMDMEKSAATGTIVALSNDSNEPTVLEGPDAADTNNPQNWNPWTKRLVFLALMSSSILADGYVHCCRQPKCTSILMSLVA